MQNLSHATEGFQSLMALNSKRYLQLPFTCMFAPGWCYGRVIVSHDCAFQYGHACRVQQFLLLLNMISKHYTTTSNSMWNAVLSLDFSLKSSKIDIHHVHCLKQYFSIFLLWKHNNIGQANNK